MARSRLTAFVAGILFAALAPRMSHGQSPKADATLAKADSALQSGNYEEAIKDFKRVRGKDKMCAECAWGLAQAYSGNGEPKKAIEFCEEFVELSSDSQVKAHARNLEGLMLHGLAGTNPKKLHEAEEAFRAALDLTPNLSEARYNLGVTLLEQGRDDEGVTELRKYLEAIPQGGHLGRARRFVENPRLARKDLGPDFALVTQQGQTITPDDLRGRVVVVDFWATWCQPCVESLPSLQKLYKRFASEGMVLISVSIDTDRQKWESFVAKEELPWPQGHDPSLDLYYRFRLAPPHMAVIPSYVMLDREGVVIRRYPGEDNVSSLESDLKKALAVEGSPH